MENHNEWPEIESSQFSAEEYYENYYREQRESYLKGIAPDYPDICFHTFEISFHINNAKNAELVYLVLDRFYDRCKIIDKQDITIQILSEDDFISQLEYVYELLSIIKSWTTLSISFNGNDAERSGLRYLTLYFLEKNNKSEPYGWNEPVFSIKKKYKSRPKKTKYPTEIIDLRTVDSYSYFDIIIKTYVNTYAQRNNVQTIKCSDRETIVIIEDELFVDFSLIFGSYADVMEGKKQDYTDEPTQRHVIIQELTNNELFKFNFAGFQRKFKYPLIIFYSFKGYNSYSFTTDKIKALDQMYPQLKIEERNASYEGVQYHFIVFEMEGVNGDIGYGIGYTTGKIHNYVLKTCQQLEEKNSRSLQVWGTSSIFAIESGFVDTFLSWEGKKKRWRLENHLTYYYFDYFIKKDSDLYEIKHRLLNEAKTGKYDYCERGQYTKPLNKWKTEELVYRIVKKLYGEYQVIYQYRPYFLKTDNGNMSYDVYICGLKIAIEYQGKQHFEPVDFFGGKDNFKQQQERDKKKAELSNANGVKLVYVNYWEDVTVDLIREKIESANSRG